MIPFLKICWNKLIALFKQGLSPKELALSIVVALLVSVLPIVGVDMLILSFVALPLRLNLPIMITLNYAATPLKFFTLVPFIKFGAIVFGTQHNLLSYQAIKDSFEKGFFYTIGSLSYEVICGLAGWLVFAVPIAFISFFLLKGLIGLFVKAKTSLDTNQ